MDKLFGYVSTYEMREISGESSKREATFNITKKEKEEVAHEEEYDSNVVVANFMRKIKKGPGK